MAPFLPLISLNTKPAGSKSTTTPFARFNKPEVWSQPSIPLLIVEFKSNLNRERKDGQRSGPKVQPVGLASRISLQTRYHDRSRIGLSAELGYSWHGRFCIASFSSFVVLYTTSVYLALNSHLHLIFIEYYWVDWLLQLSGRILRMSALVSNLPFSS